MNDKEKILQEINRKMEKFKEYKNFELSEYNKGKIDGNIHSLLALKVFIENGYERPEIDDVIVFKGQAIWKCNFNKVDSNS